MRTAISFAVLAGALWAAFVIDLGGHTFAEHIDTISDTPEAKQLIDGTRGTVNPALEEVRDRVLGEYVEAPTWIPSDQPTAPGTANAPIVPASTLPPDADFEPQLPGRARRATTSSPSTANKDDMLEPPLPGRR